MSRIIGQFWPQIFATLLIAISVVRIVQAYPLNSQGFDEPCHIAAAIEFLDRHTYSLDPVHPPLSRIAIGLPLYLAGERFPRWSPGDPRLTDYNAVGNSVLYDSGHYLRNLILARLGVLPFYICCAVLVFVWTRKEFGSVAAVAAIFLFTTLPTVLAFAGLAYSDMAAACTQSGAVFALMLWLDRPSWPRTLLLGAAIGLGVAAKLTSLIFIAVSGVAILALRAWARDRQVWQLSALQTAAKFSIAMLLAGAVLWGTYGFEFAPVRESMGLTPAAMPSFQHFPGVVSRIARGCVLADCRIPAPSLLHGAAEAWVLNKSAPSAYLFGQTRNGGWWYFFFAALALKAPIPFLLFFLVGTLLVLRHAGSRWTLLVPSLAVFAVLFATMFVKYNAGLRHVLVLFPLMAVIAGYGVSALTVGVARIPKAWATTAVATMIIWQGASSFQSGRDYIAYFNALAGGEPSAMLLNGCDLDCGQDVFRLRDELKRRQIKTFSVALWTSADISRMELPDFEVLGSSTPAAGWVAISDRARLEGELFHTSYPPGAFDWLQSYTPVTRVGNTILLYYIPGQSSSAATLSQLASNP